MSLTSYAATVVFIDNDANAPVADFANSENIYAEVSFTPSKTGVASIITVGYDEKGRMVSDPIIDYVDVVADKEETHRHHR